jgi:hypothetical protein
MVRIFAPWMMFCVLGFATGCGSRAAGAAINPDDIAVLQAALHPRCAVGEWLSPVADRPLDMYRDDGVAHVQFGLDLESRRVGDARWPQRERIDVGYVFLKPARLPGDETPGRQRPISACVVGR